VNRQPSTISGIFKEPFPEQVAYFRRKLGSLIPTSRWDELERAAHDKAFMVAGAAKADLLNDLAAAIDRSISEGRTLEDFRKDFMATIERTGWKGFTGDESAARRAWRTRVIYQTNCTTSYNAGREAQIREGGFTYKVYRHNDSVSFPRPHHVAWDGLTLPIDHDFWRTHSPQNGWGCRCYVLGARSERAAKRLGGDPGKDIPDDWNTIDIKTGAPVGIGKGWDYAPGATVANDVSAMAKKTQQWDYSLAKAYMQDLPESKRDALVAAYRSLPSVADDLRRYAQAVLAGRKVAPYRTMGLLSTDDVRKVKKLTGGAVDGFDYAVDMSAPRHIFKEHGNEAAEEQRGQRAITPADYGRLPQVVASPDSIVQDDGKIILEKSFGEERQIAVFEILAKRKMLNLKSMRIIAKRPRAQRP